MVQIIKCETCDGDTIPLGGVSVELSLVKSDFCKHCYRTDTQKQHHFFCSLSCFHDFMLKVTNGETELEWKEPSFPTVKGMQQEKQDEE
jgi:hypothetical protein